MSTFLIRSATSPSSSYPIVLTRLGGLRSRPNPHLKFVEVPGIEPATSWSIVRHADPYTNEAVYLVKYLIKIFFFFQMLRIIIALIFVWICMSQADTDSILLTMKPIMPPYQGGPWTYPKPTTATPPTDTPTDTPPA